MNVGDAHGEPVVDRRYVNVVVYSDLLLLPWLRFEGLQGCVGRYCLGLLDLRGVLQRHTVLSLLLHLAWLNFMDH